MHMHTILFQLLSVLQQESADASALLEGLRSLSSGSGPSLPAFYRHIRRGMENGWIEVVGTDQPQDGPGRPRQVYRITRTGNVALRKHARELEVFTALALGKGS